MKLPHRGARKFRDSGQHQAESRSWAFPTPASPPVVLLCPFAPADWSSSDVIVHWQPVLCRAPQCLLKSSSQCFVHSPLSITATGPVLSLFHCDLPLSCPCVWQLHMSCCTALWVWENCPMWACSATSVMHSTHLHCCHPRWAAGTMSHTHLCHLSRATCNSSAAAIFPCTWIWTTWYFRELCTGCVTIHPVAQMCRAQSQQWHQLMASSASSGRAPATQGWLHSAFLLSQTQWFLSHPHSCSSQLIFHSPLSPLGSLCHAVFVFE